MLFAPARKPSRVALVLATLATAVLLFVTADTAGGQSSEETITMLRAQGVREGWTFSVGQTPVSERPIEELCGLVVPEDWRAGAPVGSGAPRLGLPAAFDWCESAGCPAVRDQGACGSCWAFGTVGPLECNILIRDGIEVDLSEQWLLSCNQSGYDCGGGWWAHDYHQPATDTCGGTGAVLEADFPYAAADLPCGCPYDHPYTIESWAYVGGSGDVPTTGAIKQAILDYGPISAAVSVTSAFQNYTGGVFNACSAESVNHAVVLVGWDDSQGTEGVWILRNSWGPGWGEGGYMRIEYGCSSVGYAACYVQYTGASGASIEVTPDSIDFGDVAVGGDAVQSFTVRNVGSETLSGAASGLSAPFSFCETTEYTLDPNETQTVCVQFSPTLQGSFSDSVHFSGGGGATTSVSGTGLGAGAGNTCADGPSVADGTFAGTNAGATTDGSASCGDGGAADVWWEYVAPHAGVVVIDTCGSDFDTVLSVYDACGGAELACDDDYEVCGLASRVTLDIVADSAYYVRVAGYGGETGSITLNILTTVPTHTISGRVSTAGDDPVAGVTITGLPDEPVTNENGEYTATVDYGFTGTATPSKMGYTFQPASRDYVNVIADQANQDYEATPPTFQISGQVTDEFGSALSGVSITGLPGNPVTTASGDYQATVPLGFSGTATPSKTGYTFAPSSRSYDNVTSDLSGEDYSGEQQTGALQVMLEPAGARQAGALWRVDGGTWYESGQTVAELPVGSHTVSYAAISGWITPASEQVTIESEETTSLERVYAQQTHGLVLVTEPSYAGQVTADPSPGENGEYVEGTVVALVATPEPGFQIVGWVGADAAPASGQATNTVTMISDRAVIVAFAVEPFTMYQLSTAVSGGQGWIAPGRGAYAEGTVVTLTGTPATGYRVKGWSGTDDDTSVDTGNSVTMSGNKSVSVEFEAWPDCNGDGTPDSVNIADLTSSDCNGNGVPDECEPDSDGDGTTDDCDDVDGIPDEPGEADLPPLTPVLCGFGMAETLALTLLGLGFLKRGGSATRRMGGRG